MNLHFTKSSVIVSRDASDCNSWPHRITEDWLALMAEVERLRGAINHSGHLQRKRNVAVLATLGETIPTNPEECYIPPETLAKRAFNAETEVERLREERDQLFHRNVQLEKMQALSIASSDQSEAAEAAESDESDD